MAWFWNRGERGSVTLLAAVTLTMLLGLCGLALDYGRAAAERRQAQNVADAAAQAAAYEIYAGSTESAATTTADLVLQKHGYTTSNVTLQYEDSSQAITATASSVNYVASTVTRSLPTTLMGMFGLSTMTVHAAATLYLGSGNGDCAFCLLSSSQGLTASGNTNIDVTNGNIWINDAGSGAVTVSGNTDLTATETGIVASGPTAITGSGTTTFTPAATLGAPPVADPLASLSPPSVTTNGSVASVAKGYCSMSGKQIILSGNVDCTINPGIYSSFIFSGGGTLRFNPGVYVFTNAFTISGSWDFVGSGVMIYLTCSGYSSTNTQPCNGSAGAGLTWSGTTTYQLTAPTSGTYKGLAIYYDRTNTQGITLSGQNTDNLTGTIYAKSSAATLSGTFGVNQLDSRIILDHATTSGGPTINLNFDKNYNYAVSSPRFSHSSATAAPVQRWTTVLTPLSRRPYRCQASMQCTIPVAGAPGMRYEQSTHLTPPPSGRRESPRVGHAAICCLQAAVRSEAVAEARRESPQSRSRTGEPDNTTERTLHVSPARGATSDPVLSLSPSLRHAVSV